LTRLKVRIKTVIIIILKPDLEIDRGKAQIMGRESTRVVPIQNMDKIDYYYSFKTRFKNQSDARIKSQAMRVNPIDLKKLKIIKTTLF